MAAHTRVAVGYNVQIAVDAKHKLIVDEEVTNQVVDMGLLQATAGPAREILEVDRIDLVADAGYFRTEDIAACEQAGWATAFRWGPSASRDIARREGQQRPHGNWASFHPSPAAGSRRYSSRRAHAWFAGGRRTAARAISGAHARLPRSPRS